MTKAARRGVFLDRDGVVNQVVVRDGHLGSPQNMAEFAFTPGIETAVHVLRAAGYALCVVTNQPDIARGLLRAECLRDISARVRSRLGIESVLVCPHDDDDGCECRKPLPGLLIQAAEQCHISLPDSFVIGDGWKDMDAGRSAGCRTVLIDASYNRGVHADVHAADVLAAARLVCSYGWS